MSKKPGKSEFTVQGACFECMHMGWAVFNDDTEVQRCDNCAVFKDDDEALAYALRLAAKALKSPKRRSGKRFKEILLALEIAAERTSPAFWRAAPNPEWVRELVASVARTMADLDGATGLGIAYAMQDEGLIYAPDGNDPDTDYDWLREHMDRDELEEILRDAGCEETPDGNWRVAKKTAA